MGAAAPGLTPVHRQGLQRPMFADDLISFGDIIAEPGQTTCRSQDSARPDDQPLFAVHMCKVYSAGMSTGHVLLGLLAKRPRHGYDLKHAHDRLLSGARPLAFGTVYKTLERLQRDGFAEVAETAQDGGPERTTYAITEKGRAELSRWLEQVEMAASTVSSKLVSRVVVAATLGAPVGDFLMRQRAAHLARMRELTAEKEAADSPAEVLAADYALQHLDTDLAWIETALARLAELSESEDAHA
ncbi:PadR family transcriptional regulator [Nonomuraea sp. NPDC049400]|uniref:PadR family transcriptional regulator n=1 Tax=Nonomuraea sp. NPDC049400 TaxID=3364352 RepID=UPI0037AB7F48